MTNRTPERERAERRAAALHEAVRVAIRKGEGYEEHAA